MARKNSVENKLDDEISQIYRSRCNGIQVNIMDIDKIFKIGRLAASEGRDIGDAIFEFVQTIRKN